MSHIDLPDEVVRLAEAQVAAGRAASVEDVVLAGVDALELRDQQRYEEKLSKLRELEHLLVVITAFGVEP